MKSRRCLKFGLSKSIIEMDNSLLITLICVCGGGLMIILSTINIIQNDVNYVKDD